MKRLHLGFWILAVVIGYKFPTELACKSFCKSTSQQGQHQQIKNYSYKQIVAYFLEVAIGTEHEGLNASNSIKKWNSDIRIKVIGKPTQQDSDTLKSVVNELNYLIPTITLHIVKDKPNLEIYFIPVSQFKKIEPNYKESNLGFCWIGWKNDVIHKSRVLISTVGVTQKERNHLIREELTQALGLMRDSDRYSSSIFYSGWTDTNEYSEMDKALIKLLYSPDIKAGMREKAALKALSPTNEVQGK